MNVNWQLANKTPN